jgi:hypothetical protein
MVPANVNWYCYLRDNGAIAVLCQPLGQLLIQLLLSFHLRNTIINLKYSSCAVAKPFALRHFRILPVSGIPCRYHYGQ